MTEHELVQFVQEQIAASETAGHRDRRMWAVSIAYFCGNHWLRQSSATSRDSVGYRLLRPILDPARPDIRVTLNRIEDLVTKVDSKITPNEIPFSVIPQEGGNPEDRILSDIAETEARIRCEEKAFLPHLQYASWKRCVLGSSVTKKVLRVDRDGRRDFENKDVDPWQITLDPANFHPDIVRCHSWLLHSYAVPTAELNEKYAINLKPQASLGDLYLETALFNAVGGGRFSGRANASTTPANLVHELYYGKEPGRYEQLYILARTENNAPVLIWDDANPFAGLPFMKLDFWRRIDSPWGKSVPMICLNSQDIYNLAMTNLMRYLVHASWVKWLAPAECLTPESRKALTNNAMCGLIEYQQSISGGAKPEAIRMPELPQVAPEIAAGMPDVMERSVGLARVNFGETSKRGEPAGTVKQKIDEAGSVNMRISSADAEAIKRFLYLDTTFSIVHRDFVGLAERLGDRFSDPQLLLFLQMDPRKPNLRFHLVPGALLPKTPDEYDLYLRALAGQGLMAPTEYRLAKFYKTGLVDSPADEDAIRLAEEENRQMMNGQYPPVYPIHNHVIHSAVHTKFGNALVTNYRYGPDVMDLLSQHNQEHEDAMAVKAMATMTEDAPGMGTGLEGIPPEILQGRMGGALGGRSPNRLNEMRGDGVSPEQLVANVG